MPADINSRIQARQEFAIKPPRRLTVTGIWTLPYWRLAMVFCDALINARRGGCSLGLAPTFPSVPHFYQGLTFYSALTYGVDGDRIDRANFRIIGVGNRGLSSLVYRIKVAGVCSEQGRRNAWGARLGKIADAKFHARKIKRQSPIRNGRDMLGIERGTHCIYGT
jgi:hypothetical protein